MEAKKDEKKTQLMEKDEKRAQPVAPDHEPEDSAEARPAKGGKSGPRIRSTMIEAGADRKAHLTEQFTGIWRILNPTQLVMVALIIVLGMVLAGFIGSRMATRTDLGTRLGDLEQRVAEMSNKISQLDNRVSSLKNGETPSAGPSDDEGLSEPTESAGPPMSARPSAQPSE